jgi:ABC-2 type transport system ATP-binding protein
LNAIELERITKTFDKVTAVDDLSLTVPQGTVYGFIGPNGSGKTTTLRMIMNIFYPDRGTIKVMGEQHSGACSDWIGYLPEERGLYRRMKVGEILEFYGRLKSGKDVRKQVSEWLERLDLSGWADKKVETLSKGMSQKVQFIAAVVSRPEILILDEPFTGLDPVNADVLRSAVLELQREGTTVVFSTHDMSMAEKMCDFIFMIFRGSKVLDGTLAAIQEQYGSDTLRIRCDCSASALTGLHGVAKVNDFGQVKEIRMTPDCDAQDLVAGIMGQTRVMSFEITKPSLHDIFVRIAGPAAREAADA